MILIVLFIILVDNQIVHPNKFVDYAVIFVSFSLLTLLLSAYFTSRFLRPLKDFTLTIEDITRGSRRTKDYSKHSAEFERLGNAINRMTETIAKSDKFNLIVRNRLDVVMDNTVNGILLVNSKDLLVFANPVAMYMLAIDSSMLGQLYYEVITNKDMVEMITQTKEHSRSLKKELAIANQNQKIFAVNMVPIFKRENAYQPEILIILNDISEIKNLQQVRQDFVANITYELKTPVAQLKGLAERAAGDGASKDVVAIKKGIDNLDILISDLLFLSLLDSGSINLKLKSENLSGIINEAVHFVKKKRDFSDIEVTTTSNVSNIIVSVDKEHILRAVINLLENAINYSTKDQKVSINIDAKGDHAMIRFIDNGPGIAPEDIPFVFNRFFRVDKDRSRLTGGTGLGLAIVKHIIEIHGGNASVISESGKGSAFLITLPLNK